MVEELRSAQASFGAALVAHHTNMQSYMQLLLDEARRLAAVSKITSSRESKSQAKNNEDDDTSLKTVTKDNVEDLESETQARSDPEKKHEELQTDIDLTQHTSFQKMESIEQITQNKRELLFHEETVQQIKELKMTVQRLEIENSNLILKLENLKSHHEMEIEFLKKINVQEAMLWESRIEKIQQFCLSLEKEYGEKIDKMKQNEEELIRSHKGRVQVLQAERLSDMQQLSDLHKAIMEQAFNTSAIYPSHKGELPRSSVIKSPERPANFEELTDREAALLRKERQLEESRLDWEEERRRGIEAAMNRERVVRELEASWESRRESESRELARREARTEELSRLVEEMREQALTEAKELAAEKLRVQTDRARLEALMKAETGVIANPEHILQMRAEVEAGLEETKEMKGALENERRRLREEWTRLEARALDTEARERDVARYRDEVAREREDLARERDGYTRLKEEAERAEARARLREEEAADKTAHLEQQIKEITKERLQVKRDKLEIETAKTRLDLLLPELGPNESFTINPPRNYIDPKAVILRLKAEKELESYVVTPAQRKPFL